MALPRLATFTVNGAQKYGAVTDSGIVDLSAHVGKEFPTLREPAFVADVTIAD